MLSYPFKFQIIKGIFKTRVNRFVTEVSINGSINQAYLPNPGRLFELLLPGTELLLSPALAKGKLPYTVLACFKDGHYILLHTHLTNLIVSRLLQEGLVEHFKNYRVIRREPVYGHHRFDLLLEDKTSKENYYLEIKSTTLFEGAYAMFPDAVTKRGTAHLLKLKELSQTGVKTGCLFVVMWPRAEFFIPAYSIDPLFAQTFSEVKNEVDLNAVALCFDPSFSKVSTVKNIAIPYGTFEEEQKDKGYYLLIVALNEEHRIETGSLGVLNLARGFYVYVGSAKQGLSKRINRHKRKLKNKHWHIDYLTAKADKIEALPFVSSADQECNLAASLGTVADRVIKKFGSSDCRCPGHLFYFKQPPAENPDFVKIVQKHRFLHFTK